MLQFYPLNPVVTSNGMFANMYNENPYSAFLTSACVSPAEFESLVAGGAKFDAVCLVNGAGKEVLAASNGDETRIEYIDASNVDEGTLITQIHGVIGTSADLFDAAG